MYTTNHHLLCDVAMNIMRKMEGSNAFEISFRKKYQVESLVAKITVGAEEVPIDSQLLVHRPPHYC